MIKQKVKEILLDSQIKESAICEFSFVANNLIDCRAKARLPKNAKSIIMAAFPYKVKDEKPLNISRYAAVKDYHIVCKNMLEAAKETLKIAFPNNAFEVFLDNSPIPEVAAANHCGLGLLGKNGLIINETYGSFVFLGEIVTDLELDADKGGKKCLDCGRCISSCPINMCKEQCLSSVNQQKKALTDTQIEQIRSSGCVWGCDICSDVCPHNENAQNTYIAEFINSYRNSYVVGEDVSERAYTWRGEAVINRNAKIVNNK